MQNLSPRNAFVRFALGSMMTACGTVQLIRNPKSRRGQMLILVGSMKVAEGATKFCPRKAMSSSMMDMQQMMAGNVSQGASASAGTTMNSGTNSGQSTSSGIIKQMVGNVAQAFTGGASQNGSQNMSTNTGQNTASGNKSGTAFQSINDIAQAAAQPVGQIVNDITGMAGNQNATASGSSANSDANTKKASNNTNASSGNTKSTSANGNNKS